MTHQNTKSYTTKSSDALYSATPYTSMENCPIVVPPLRERQKVLTRPWRNVAMQLDVKIPEGCADLGVAFLLRVALHSHHLKLDARHGGEDGGRETAGSMAGSVLAFDLVGKRGSKKNK